ncbi:MAG: hypothetical protein PHQ28_04030 [Mycobacterium sp.]|nr:hypothetical protein [Mycobacterium sp.]
MANGVRVGEQWTRMQRGGTLGDVEIRYHSGVLPVGALGGLGIPSGPHRPTLSTGVCWAVAHAVA